MNQSSINQILQDLDQKIHDLTEIGHLDADQQAAIAHAQTALILAQAKQWEAAAAEYDAAIALCAADPASLALNHYGKAIVLFHLSDRRPETRTAITAALRGAIEIGHAVLAAKCYFFQASLDRETGDILSALKSTSRALRCIDKANPNAQASTLTIAILRTRSSTYVLLGQFDRARADLDRAFSLAQTLRETHLAYAIQLDRQFLKTLTQAEDDWVESDRFLQTLLSEAQAAGAGAVIGDINLYLALVAAEREDWEVARDRAIAARDNATQATDPQRYSRFLAASLAIAQAQEALDEKVATLDALLVAYKSLQSADQPEAATLVEVYLELLPLRWGSATFQRIFQIHQNRERVRRQFNHLHLTPQPARSPS